jgi:hypothetical protein
MKSVVPGIVLAVALVGAAAAAGSAQSLPFDDKARYEKVLEQKADDVLMRLLGPNQAQVVIEATMDFNRTEKVEINSAPARDKSGAFKWQAAGGDVQSGDYLLPGFPDPAAVGSGPENSSYDRQTIYPSAFVKRMDVSVILNQDLPDQQAQNVRAVISQVLMLDAKRGDQLSVIKTPFAPIWKTVWYTPEAISMVLKYLMLAVMGIIAMIVVAVGFLKLAGAMSTMAKVQQSHQITMDLGKGAGPAGLDQPAALGLPGPGEKTAAGGGEIPAPAEGEQVVFNVRLAQVPFLVNMMSGEDPANVALVAAHLLPDVRSEFFKKLPAAFASDVVLNMTRIRFLEPEIITTLKDELERRLSGAVGGINGALQAIENIGLRAKRNMLEDLRKKNPELAAELRKRVLLPDDLSLLSDRDLSLMVGSVKMEDWASAMFELPEAARKKIRAQMADKMWEMIEQSMRFGAPSSGKAEDAMERIMAVAAGMIKDGRIAAPSVSARPLIADGQAA